MEYIDYYAVLGVARDADSLTIKRAFRVLARQLHPDLNPGNSEAERRFKEVNEAYDVLGDEEKRRMYDRLGAQWPRGQRSGGFDWSSYFQQWDDDETNDRRTYRTTSRREETPPDAPDEESPFSDFFQQLFNAGPRAKGPRVSVYETTTGPRGGEQTLPIEITLEEAFQGTQRTMQQGGSRFEVFIPKGVTHGSRVRIVTPAGEMILAVQIKPHSLFALEEHNLRTKLPVDLYTALLGGEARVPTLEGTLALVIPANTQNGRTFRLKGQGMPTTRNPEERGDLLVEVVVELPVPLGEEERRLFAQLRRMRPPTGSQR